MRHLVAYLPSRCPWAMLFACALITSLLSGRSAVAQASDEVIAPLVAALKSEDTRARKAAADALGRLGPQAVAAAPALVSQLRDDQIASSVVYALVRIGAGAVPALEVGLLAEEAGVRRRVVTTLGLLGPQATSASPALARTLADSDGLVSDGAASALVRVGGGAVPSLVDALSNAEPRVRGLAANALTKVGIGLKAKGTLLWWVVPGVYLRELIALLVALVTFFLLGRRFPRAKPATKPLQAAHVAAVALVPTLTAGAALFYATTREWAQGFIPDPVLTVLPFPTAAVFSVAFACVLAAIWACQRKPVEGDDPTHPLGAE